MNEPERDHAWIGGREVPLTREEPPRQSEQEIMDEAQERLQQKRDSGGETHNDELRDAGRESDALDTLRRERTQAADAAKQAERDEAEEQRQQADRHVAEATDWPDSDKQVLSQLQQRVKDFQTDAQAFQQAQAWAQRNPNEVTPQQRAELAEAAQRLSAEQAELQQAGQQVQSAAQIRAAEAERRRLYKDIPELKDSSTREEFIKWAEGQGIPRDEAMRETRRSVVGPVWKKFQAEKAQAKNKRLNRPRRVVQQQPGASDRLTVNEARAQLKQNGRFGDAVNLLHLQRERANEAES